MGEGEACMYVYVSILKKYIAFPCLTVYVYIWYYIILGIRIAHKTCLAPQSSIYLLKAVWVGEGEACMHMYVSMQS